MAEVDFSKYLGKRVRFYYDIGIEGISPERYEGTVIAFVKYDKEYEPEIGEFLFLPDGESEPDFYSGEFHLQLLN